VFIQADTLDDLLRHALEQILARGVRVKASRGWNTELTGVLLKLANPRARLSHTETRGKVFSPLGELAWFLAGSNDADFISYYISDYRKEAEPDGTIRGAYGPRMFAPEGQNQFENVAALLRRKVNSRQAVIQLFDGTDLASAYRDVPCTCTLQFMVRDGRLSLTASMRSNDAYKGLPHDVFSFTMIQEIMARTLGVEVGDYTHFVCSLHVYDDNLRAANNMLDEGVQATVNAAMMPMPEGDPRPAIRRFLQAEAEIRAGREVEDPVNSLPDYWQDLVRLLRVFSYSRSGDYAAVTAIKGQMADPFFREYIKMREEPRRSVRGE
jgi:thymidylate synthase